MAKKPQGDSSDISSEGIAWRLKNTDLNTYFIFGAIILVLVVGIYAIFSPAIQNSGGGNPACGKIVIATDGPRLSNLVAPTLSEARFFLVVDPLSKKLLEAIRNPYRSPQPNQQIVYLIAGKGEEAVIVGTIDQQCYNMLMQFGIRVFGGYDGQARKAISLYRQARIAQSAPVETTPQTPMMAQVPQAAQGGGGFLQNNAAAVPGPEAAAQPGVGQAGFNFVCPQCRLMANSPSGMCPMCPNCRVQMLQQNGAQAPTAAGWGGMPDMAGNSMGNPYCQMPIAQGGVMQGGNMNAGWGMQGMTGNGMGNQYCPVPMAQGAVMQGGNMNAGWGMPDMAGNSMGNPYCQMPIAQGGVMQGGNMNAGWGMQGGILQGDLPVAFGMPDMNTMGMDAMGNPVAMGNQAAFGWGEQGFVCPNCNWRLRCARQGNKFPNCPNCNSPMALDIAKANNGWKWWSDGQWAAGQQAANMTQLRPQFNTMTNQPNFWQGPESTGFFICPNCNWRMYSQQGQSQYPRCPNCQQIMARSGAYYQRQNVPLNNQVYLNTPANGAGATRVALQTPTTVKAPPIFRDAVMPHAYRGVCENCHIVKADIPIAANAKMPHPYRGVCSNCHKILGVPAGAGNTTAANAGSQPGNAVAQNQDTARVILGGAR